MKKYTDEVIMYMMKDVWPIASYDHAEYSVEENTDDLVKIKVSKMYESPAINFSILKRVSDFFETENINDDDRFAHGGCETCDYGSSYGFTLSIRPDND